MTPKSAKAKGRRLQNTVAQIIRDLYNLSEADVKPALMSEGGADIKLSSVACDVFPFAVECKNSERLKIWEALAQAEKNAGELTPLLVFKRNRSGMYCAMRFEDLLALMKDGE